MFRSRLRSNLPRSADAMRNAFRFRLDRDGLQHFNFKQYLWLNESVRMGFTQAPSTALTTLALNMLFLAATTGSSGSLRSRGQRRRQHSLARQFAHECLLTAPPMGWIIPREVVLAWVRAHCAATRDPRAAGHGDPNLQGGHLPGS